MPQARNSQYSPVSRKFHDAWALILYLIATISINSYHIMNMSNKTDIFTQIPSKLIIITLTYILSFISFIILSLILFPGPMMHAGFIIAPILSIFISFYIQNPVSIFMSLLFGSLSIAAYIFWYRKNIKYSAVIVKESTGILLKNILSLLIVFIPSALLIVGQIFITSMSLKQSDGSSDARITVPLFVLQMYWTYFVILYSNRIVVSSLISFSILSVRENMSIFIESVKNTIMSMGSVCFGGLIVALIYTLRYLNNRERSEQRNALAAIFQVIVAILLALLQSIAEFINEYTFTYMALYGKGYVNCVKGGFEVLTRGDNSILLNSMCIYPILQLYSILGGILYFMVLVYTGCLFDGKNLLNETLLIAIGSVVLVNLFIRSFESANMAFLFTNDYDKEAVKSKHPKAADAMEEQALKG